MGPKTAISMLIGAILGKRCCSTHGVPFAVRLPCQVQAVLSHLTSLQRPGFGVLGPYARSQGWAPGPIGSWRTGATGWDPTVQRVNLTAPQHILHGYC